MVTLFTKQPMALQGAYSELKRRAFEQPSLLVGTPGSILARDHGRFLYRDYYGPDGKKAADYIGPVGDNDAELRANELRGQIAFANELIDDARLLAQNGFVRVDSRVEAVLAALANNGVLRRGATVIGSHAFGALLNDLGARAVPFATDDLDIARDRSLELRTAKRLADILRESRVPLAPVPRLERKERSTSFALIGRSKFRVDLLVPTRGTDVKILPVHELDAYATALPFLGYLLHEPSPTIVMGRNAIVPVRVPQPERFACHKMLVSQMRRETSDKRRKDIEQAAILVAVLAELAPEALEKAFAAIPRTASKRANLGARRVLARLESTSHAQAVELMKSLLE